MAKIKTLRKCEECGAHIRRRKFCGSRCMGKAFRRKNEARNLLINERLQNGELYQDIADDLGISAGNVCVIAKQFGIRRPKKSLRGRALTATRVREVLRYDPQSGNFFWKQNRQPHLINNKAGAISRGYIVINIDGRKYMAHRLVWMHEFGIWPSKYLDHINIDRRDNRLENLREASHAQNMANTSVRSSNTSGFKGIHYVEHANSWRVRLADKHIGYFKLLEDAVAAHKIASIQKYGEFARSAP